MSLIAAAKCMANAALNRRNRIDDLSGSEAVEYAAQHPGTAVCVSPAWWMAYDGLGGVAWDKSREAVLREVARRNGKVVG